MLYFDDNYNVVIFSEQDAEKAKKKDKKSFWKKHKKGIITALALGGTGLAALGTVGGVGIANAVEEKKKKDQAEKDRKAEEDAAIAEVNRQKAIDALNNQAEKDKPLIQLAKSKYRAGKKQAFYDAGIDTSKFNPFDADDYIHGRV